MQKLWIGYNGVAMCQASSAKALPYVEQLLTTTGMPVMCGSLEVWMIPGTRHQLELAALVAHYFGKLIVTRNPPSNEAEMLRTVHDPSDKYHLFRGIVPG
ncbi:MAG: hypothetical protein IT379_17225 [Deltaproteobacteria bacterium]|nr:hypothetical protein [Deltaproteobacteria bacterium]